MSDACSDAPAAAASPCPVCAGRGHRVPRQTPRSLLRPAALERLPRAQLGYCPTPTCPVVYHDRECRFLADELRVPVFEKTPAGDRLVCYCLEIPESELQSAGGHVVIERIRALVSHGRCACDLRNPEGRCCLERVEALARDLDPRSRRT